MKKLSLYAMEPTNPQSPAQTEPEEARRNELCLQLAENLHDLGACEFTIDLKAGGDRYVVRVTRAA
jgi:hypothetical protein